MDEIAAIEAAVPESAVVGAPLCGDAELSLIGR